MFDKVMKSCGPRIVCERSLDLDVFAPDAIDLRAEPKRRDDALACSRQANLYVRPVFTLTCHGDAHFGLVVKYSGDPAGNHPAGDGAPNLLFCYSFEEKLSKFTKLSLVHHFAKSCEEQLGVVTYPLARQTKHECFLRVLLTVGLLGAKRVSHWEDIVNCLLAKVRVAILA